MEYTFSMIKPDVIERNLIGRVINYFEEAGLKIIAQKMLFLNENQVESFYCEHKKKSFFNELVKTMTSGPIIAQVLQGENAILQNRKMVRIIRETLAISFVVNSIHGSDSEESAEREISFFFDKTEIFKNLRTTY